MQSKESYGRVHAVLTPVTIVQPHPHLSPFDIAYTCKHAHAVDIQLAQTYMYASKIVSAINCCNAGDRENLKICIRCEYKQEFPPALSSVGIATTVSYRAPFVQQQASGKWIYFQYSQQITQPHAAFKHGFKVTDISATPMALYSIGGYHLQTSILAQVVKVHSMWVNESLWVLPVRLSNVIVFGPIHVLYNVNVIRLFNLPAATVSFGQTRHNWRKTLADWRHQSPFILALRILQASGEKGAYMYVLSCCCHLLSLHFTIKGVFFMWYYLLSSILAGNPLTYIYI